MMMRWKVRGKQKVVFGIVLVADKKKGFEVWIITILIGSIVFYEVVELLPAQSVE